MSMTNDDRYYLQGIAENEGFDYCYRHYSSFEKVKDEEFHKLREAYVKAANDLEVYVGVLE